MNLRERPLGRSLFCIPAFFHVGWGLAPTVVQWDFKGRNEIPCHCEQTEESIF